MASLKNITISVAFALVFLFLGIVVGQRIVYLNEPIEIEAIRTIYHDYAGQIDNAKLLAKLTSSLDPYSYYLTKTEYEQVLQEETNGQIGIGIVYKKTDNGLQILSVLPNSPAENAGIKRDMYITKINNLDTSTMTISQIATEFRKDKGETIDLEIDGKSVQLVFSNLSQSIVTTNLNPDTGYIKIFTFWPTTNIEFENLISEFSQKKNIIIDLRDNFGGNTESMLAIAKNFISNGPFLIEEFKTGEKIVSSGSPSAPLTNKNVILLVNSETASAAEELALAMQQNYHAKVIGEKTYGKGVFGNSFELRDGSAIHITVGHWYSGNHQGIEGTGITPDLQVTDERANGVDAIYESAVASL